jgi:TRAP transporter 4TM/12TM fusion protein
MPDASKNPEALETGILSEQKPDVLKYILIALALILTYFEIYTAATMPLQPLAQRSLHLGLMAPIILLIKGQTCRTRLVRGIHYLCAAASAVVYLYVYFNWTKIALRYTSLLPLDFVFAIVGLGLVLFITYRVIGIWMPLIALVFVAYSYFGPSLSGILHFRAISLQRFLATAYFSEDGVFGVALGVSATYVFLFVMFGECLIEYGGGQFMIDLAESLFGRFRGGSTKIAVITAGLFGMVSGNSPIIVASTGPLTMPLIKKAGYSSEYAGGVVAAASVGGLIMPPVMGAAAFVMADVLNIPYGDICIKAVICALLYFGTLFLMADLRAVMSSDKGISNDQLPSAAKAIKEGWHHLISVIVLIYLLCYLQWSASKAALWASCALLIAYYIKGIIFSGKINIKTEIKRIVNICTRSAAGMCTACAACACAGIITGSLAATGINVRLSAMLVQAANGNLLLLLILAMVGDIILGMGIPALSCYVILAVMVAPALITLGVSPFAAHMFVFYFGIMSSITPPVGLAFYVASGIAGSEPMKTGFTAWKFALPGFILPFVFVYNNALLLEGTAQQILWVVFSCVVGLCAISFGIEGYIYGAGKLNTVPRILLICAAIITIIPEMISTFIGLGIILLVVMVQFFFKMGNKRKAILG